MEEIDNQVSTNLEEPLSTENVKPPRLNKHGKPKKELTPEALERLAKAREKANAMRQQNYAKRLELKAKKIKEKNEIAKTAKTWVSEPCEEPKAEPEEPESEEPEAEAEEPPKIIKQKVSKKKPVIIVEQSSDDDDEFESNEKVLFVKRVSRKKKEPVKHPEPVEPPEPRRPSSLQLQYDAMFNGSFLNQQRRRY